MGNTGDIHSVKGCVGSGMLFCFKCDGNLCHPIVSGRIILKHRSKKMYFLLNYSNCTEFQYMVNELQWHNLIIIIDGD